MTLFLSGNDQALITLQGIFPKLKDRLSYEERGERNVILYVITKLFNLQSRLVGISQILSTYMQHLGP